MFEAKEIIYQNKDWVTLIFFTILLILTFLKILFKERLSQILTLFLSKKYLLIYFNKDRSTILSVFQISLFVIQTLILSLIIYFSFAYFGSLLSESNFTQFLSILLGVSLYFGVRYLIGLFLAFLFNLKLEHSKIIYDKVNYFNNLILWIIPFLIISIYAQNFHIIFFKITCIIFLILLAIRYILVLSNNKKLIFNNLFYFILYLCALEIAPLLIIIKLTI